MNPLSPDESPASEVLDASVCGESRVKKGATLRQRVVLLVACLVLGLGAGFVGLYFTSDTTWFLAVPVCMAIGWFFVADPTACTPSRP